MESHIDSDHNENDEEDEEERQALLDLEEHLRRKLHRQARQAPNLCIKDETVNKGLKHHGSPAIG